MAHGDERGLKLPPKVAPIQVVIVPIAQEKENVKEEAEKLENKLNGKFRTKLDLRENYSVGYKFNDWEMRGVPLRVEIGPKELENGEAILTRRDNFEKVTVKLENIEQEIETLLEDIQKSMYQACEKRLEEKNNNST